MEIYTIGFTQTTQEIFGDELEPFGDNTYATLSGRGERSLGVMQTHRWAKLDIVEGGGAEKLRLATKSLGGREWDRITVTDASFFEPDQTTIRRPAVDAANERFGRRDPFFMMLGLSRP